MDLSITFVLLVLICHVHSAPNSRRSRAAGVSLEETNSRQSKLEEKFKESSTTASPAPSNRKNKALNLFGYFPSFLSSGLDYSEDDDDDVTFSVNDDHFDDEDLSRTIPSRRRQQNKKKNGNGDYQNDNINSLQYDNSPIFYIRLPPTPYMFVPGLGYVSQPPSMGPPMGPMMPPGVPPVADPFINLPIDFISNGKPTGVYQWNGGAGYPQVPQMPQLPPVDFGYGGPQPMIPSVPRPGYNTPSYSKPKPKPTPSNSKVTNLKGPYVFNGKPNDNVYVLRDTYNSIYSDALQNFYP
ncbi:WW domain-binding protein 11 [Achroia grisella]|uniref:WW domain-binding protein 11 n=1 Tax=Achroia grisella TaxID=688607 RepID=UPI0027D22EC4|nr:WW domain-binding protein 11 [Achroia grisella]